MLTLISTAAAYSRHTHQSKHMETNGIHVLHIDRWVEKSPMKINSINGNTDIKEFYTTDPNFILSLQSTYPNIDAQAISRKMRFSSNSNTVYYKISFVGEATSKVRPSKLMGTQVAFRKEDGGLIHIVIIDSQAHGEVEAWEVEHEKKYVKIFGARKTLHNRGDERWRPLNSDEINQIKNMLQEHLAKFESNPFY